MGTIVVSYVDKPEGRAALRRAAAESRLRRSSVTVVDTRADVSQPDEGLRAWCEKLRADGVECEVRTLEPEQEAADGINGLADEIDAEMIVIGLRRRSPVGKLMLGQNAQRILLDASCPVLTVKSDRDDDAEEGDR